MRRIIGMITLLACLTAAASASAQQVTTVELPDVPFTHIRLSADGLTALAFTDPVLIDYANPVPPLALIDAATGTLTTLLDGDFDFVADAQFSADGTLLYTLHANGELIAWDVASASEQARMALPWIGPARLIDWGGRPALITGQTTVLTVLFPDIATGAITEIVRITDIERYSEFRELLSAPGALCQLQATSAVSGPPPSLFGDATLYLALASDAILAAESDGSFTQIDEPAQDPCRFSVRRINWTADGNIAFYTAADDGVIVVLDPRQGVRTLEIPVGSASRLVVVPGTNTGYFVDVQAETLNQIDLVSGAITPVFSDPAFGLRAWRITDPQIARDGSRLMIGLVAESGALRVDLP